MLCAYPPYALFKPGRPGTRHAVRAANHRRTATRNITLIHWRSLVFICKRVPSQIGSRGTASEQLPGAVGGFTFLFAPPTWRKPGTAALAPRACARRQKLATVAASTLGVAHTDMVCRRPGNTNRHDRQEHWVRSALLICHHVQSAVVALNQYRMADGRVVE